mmetsp:Transcript_12956/g.40379  ORF Transcript_12956/g.40379 Transcript_12956/m.40379 type:complete len:217 (+) Transcript_12956:218-868(+)
MSLMLPPVSATTRVSVAIPPGRSLTTQLKRTMRDAYASARSSTRPSTVTSMLEPQRGTATVLPSRPGMRPASTAARPVAPAPSCTMRSCSTSASTATAMSCSLTVTVSSMRSLMTPKLRAPMQGTARPSASVGPGISTHAGLPASSAARSEAQREGSTAITRTSGRSVLTASRMPAMSPPPPAGTTIASRSPTCSSSSSPTVPAPAMICLSSKPLM